MASTIKQGNLNNIPYPGNIKNNWDFKLGNTPIDLTINAGAYTGTYELGGLSLNQPHDQRWRIECKAVLLAIQPK